MIFQTYALYPCQTVRQYLSFLLRILMLPKAQQGERNSQLAEIFEPAPLLDRRPKYLSGGPSESPTGRIAERFTVPWPPLDVG